MSTRTRDAIQAVLPNFAGMSAYPFFIKRLAEGNALTRDENPSSHFCVYFAAYDPEAKLVFMGHHKKSDLWLFNGGHIDLNETPLEALAREIGEEWGPKAGYSVLTEIPSLITVTEIDNPRQSCRRHYDMWYFVPMAAKVFNPDQHLLEKEFYQTRWLSIDDSFKIVNDKATLEALKALSEIDG